MLRYEIRFWAIRVFLTVFAVFMVNRLFFFSPTIAEKTLSYILYPVLVVQNKIISPLSAAVRAHPNMQLLQKEYESLIDVNQNLQAQLTQLLAQKEFVQQTQEIRTYAQKYKFDQKIIAQIIVKNFGQQGNFYFIDKGSMHGISKNMVVLYKNNIVGRISQVLPLYSKVTLITDKHCNIAVYCKKFKNQGILKGDNSSYPVVDFVPHYKKIACGDYVMSAGKGLIFPEGFVLGKIDDFYVDGVSYKIKVQPLVDFQELDFVYVVKN